MLFAFLGDNHGRGGIADAGAVDGSADEVSQQDGSNGCACGIEGSAPLDELVAPVAATAKGVEHGVDDDVEQAHRESRHKGAGYIDSKAAGIAREELYAHADEAYCDGQQRGEFVSFTPQYNACRDAHAGVGNEIGQGAELCHGVARAELVLDDDSHRAREVGHEGYHEEQQEHHNDRNDCQSRG